MRVRMKLSFAGLLLSAFAGIALAQSATRSACFENAGLKDRIRISYAINDARVTGEWIVERDYDAAQAEKFAFTGTRSGATLSVQFTGRAIPESLPPLTTLMPKREQHAWTLATIQNKPVLRVEQYGRNYQTNTYGNYFADYPACTAG